MEIKDQSYWVVIPTKLFFDGKDNKNSRGLYGLISSLSKKEGYCYASNQLLADIIKVSNPTIQRWLKKLQDMNYIKCEYNETLKNSDKRKIYINGEWGVSSNNDETGLIKIALKRGDGSHQNSVKMMTNIKKENKNDSPRNGKTRLKDKTSMTLSSDRLLLNKDDCGNTKKPEKQTNVGLKSIINGGQGDGDVVWDTHTKLYQYINLLDKDGNILNTDEAKKFKILAYYAILGKQKIENKSQWDYFVKRNIRAVTRLVEQGWDCKKISLTALMLEAKGISWGLEAIERWLPRLDSELAKQSNEEELRYRDLYSELKINIDKLNKKYESINKGTKS